MTYTVDISTVNQTPFPQSLNALGTAATTKASLPNITSQTYSQTGLTQLDNLPHLHSVSLQSSSRQPAFWLDAAAMAAVPVPTHCLQRHNFKVRLRHGLAGKKNLP